MDKKNRKAIFAGSFDPITNGHLDIKYLMNYKLECL